MPLAAGQTLECYEIRGSLGVGGMGEVYRASDTRASPLDTGELVALRTDLQPRIPLFYPS